MNVKMLHDDGSVDQKVFPDLDSPSLYTKDEANKRAIWILDHFKESHKTESALCLTFCRLDRNDIAYLKAYWQLEDEWAVFKRICSMHKIKVA
jgi:hypothetical protein